MNNVFLYIVTVVIWGTTWIAINYQLGSVAPEVSVFYRFALASVMLFSYCLLRRLPLAMSFRKHGQLLAFGMMLFGLNYFLLYNAQQHINSALTSIAFSTLMVMNIINARIWYKTQINNQVYLGAALGIIGIVTLFWPQITDVELGPQTLLGLGLCLLGTLSASTGNMISIKNQKDKMPVMQANAWGMLYGAIFMAVLALVQGKAFTFDSSWAYIGSLLYLSLFGSVIAFGCYLTLMTSIGAHKTSYTSIMFPAVAVMISTFVENFHWSWFTVIGFISILAGNLVVLARPAKTTPPSVPNVSTANTKPSKASTIS
jgi:drug/metabolite transporter (DMT)-like permease